MTWPVADPIWNVRIDYVYERPLMEAVHTSKVASFVIVLSSTSAGEYQNNETHYGGC